MADTAYKSKVLVGLEPTRPAIGGLAPRTLMRWSPLGALMRAQDTVPASSRRVVVDWTLGGAIGWAQPRGTDLPDPASGWVYPHSDTWRRLSTHRVMVTPGCELAARVFYCPAGIVTNAIDEAAGIWAEARIGATWTNGASSVGPHYRGCLMEGSQLGAYGGAQNSEAGANWADLRHRDIFEIRPPEFASDPAVASVYSEWSSVELRIEVRGGARVTQIVIYEVPLAHVQAHDDDGEKSVHALPTSLAPQTPMPQSEPGQPPAHEEHRGGLGQLQDVAQRQSERLGPRIASIHSWRESDATIWQQAEGNPITTASATMVDLFDSAITTYSQDNPGWIVAAGHAKLHRLCEPRRIMRGGAAAVVPVRVRVDASRSAGTGVVRVRSGAYEWVDVNVTGGRAWYTATGYLESQVHGDHSWANLQLFGQCSGGGTLSVYGVAVDFGAW